MIFLNSDTRAVGAILAVALGGHKGRPYNVHTRLE